jgi:UMF1 family MFS transporter
MQLNDKRVINGWAFFDWANSAYYLVVSTAVFPIYYSHIAPDYILVGNTTIASAAMYSFAVSFAYILIAFVSPLLSGIADYSGRRMTFLKGFTLAGALGCIALFFFDSPEAYWIGMIAFIIGAIGAAGGLVFYDSYLPLIATEDRYDKVSARGYSYGYVGSVILLLFCLLLIQKPLWFGITNPTLPTRLSFVFVGLWWLGFSQITFRRLPKDAPSKFAWSFFQKGRMELVHVWQKIKHDKNILRFLGSYFFYIAGVHTVIYLASLFASEVLEFEDGELIMTILLLQLVAIPGALLFAAVSKWKGNKTSLMIQLFIWVGICMGAYLIQEKWHFYLLAATVGLVLGGIQSLSRSTYAKLLEDRKEDPTSFFSFYDVLSKIAIVSGTFFFGLVNSMTGNMRYSVLVLAVFFALGIMMLITVDKNRLSKEGRGEGEG